MSSPSAQPVVLNPDRHPLSAPSDAEREYVEHRAAVRSALRTSFPQLADDWESLYHDAWIEMLELRARGKTTVLNPRAMLKTIAQRRAIVWPALAAAALWAVWIAGQELRRRTFPTTWLLAAGDLVALTALTYESGGAISQLRKAFILLPLVAALISTPQATARWAVAAVVSYVLISLPHPEVDGRGGYDAIAAHAIYLAWGGVAAVLLARLARSREVALIETSESRRRLVGELLNAEDQARRALAYNLHDESLQSLLAARRDLDRALAGDAVAESRLRSGLSVATTQLRSAVRDLHPHTLEQTGLEEAVTQLARRTADRTGLHFHVDLAASRCADQLAFSLLRELITNIEKHAHATDAWITATPTDDGHTTITTVDNGRGMQPAQPFAALQDGHIGLASIRERTEASGGTFTLDPGPGEGVMVTITLPNAPSMDREQRGDDVGLAPPVTATNH